MIRRLPVKLTEAELLAKGEEIAEAVGELAHLEQEKKNVAKRLGDEMKDVRADISKLAKEIGDEAELRDVSCSEVPDYKEGTMAIIRDDTGENVSTRVMSEDERQHKLELLEKRRVGEEN